MISKLDLYRVFCQVVKDRSFSKSAKNLYMTQPAVSQAIMNLERELDTRLFTRTPKGVILTDEGEILYEHARSAIKLINAGENKLLFRKNLMTGDLKIGVGDTTLKYLLLEKLEVFHRDYPNIKLKIVNRTTPELCDLLKSGSIDVAICNLPINDKALEIINFKEIQDIFVCGKEFKNRIKEPLDFKGILDFSLILLEPKSNSRQYLEKFMKGKNLDLGVKIELGSHDLLLEFAKINFGIACVVKEFSKEYLERGLLYEIKTIEKIPKRNIGLCFLKSVSLSPASKKFLELLKNEV